VTEANPAHWLDFRRFSSDQVAAFNRAQVEAIRKHSPAPILHNYMGRIMDFDHFKVGADLDAASWDSYPLGFLEDRSDRARRGRPRFAGRVTRTSRPSTTTSTARSGAAAGG
jgi:beta-galactosidase